MDFAGLMEPTLEQKRRLERWRLSTFWVMLIGYIGYYIGRGNLSAALPLLSKEFGYTNSQLAIIGTFSELAYALGKFTTGPLADKLNGKLVFIAGLCGAIVFNLLFPLGSEIVWFTVIWCFCRYFLSMGWGGIIKTIGEWYEAERNGTVMGFISINFQFGSAVATLFCGWLIAQGVGWQGLFYIPAGVMTVIVIWSMLASKRSPHDVVPNAKFGRYASRKKTLATIERKSAKRSSWDIVRALFKVRMFRYILGFSILSHFLRGIFVYWTPKFLVDVGMGAASAAVSSAVVPLCGCFGTVFLGWYTDKYSKDGNRARMMWIMLFFATLSLIGVGQLAKYGVEHQYLLVTFLGISGFFVFGPYSMSAGALSLDIAGPDGAGTCTGLIDGFGYIGGAAVTFGAGYLSQLLGWSDVFMLLAGVSLLAVFQCMAMSRAFIRDAKERKIL